MISRIEFRCSWIYDEHWREIYREDQNYPSFNETRKNAAKIEKEWNGNGKEILKEIQKVSGLQWKNKKVVCYVAGRCVPFSDPLTIMSYDKYPVDYTIDVLIHELIHQLFIQGENEKCAHEAWKYFHRKYKNEEFNTRIHIPLHAIHFHIFMKFFDEKRLKREMDFMMDFPDYRRAWEIVLETGAKNIIEEFRNRVKIT